jgi:hypothetical protein
MANELTIRTPDQDLTLTRARISEEEERFDREHNRPPFSDHMFSEGSGNLIPPVVRVTVIIREATLADADLLLERLEGAAPAATSLLRGGQQRTVHGLAGGNNGSPLVITPILRGYRVELEFIARTGDWEAAP